MSNPYKHDFEMGVSLGLYWGGAFTVCFLFLGGATIIGKVVYELILK